MSTINTNHVDILNRAKGELSIRDFAKKTGISYTELYRYLRANRVPEHRRGIIAEASEGRVKPEDFSPLWAA